MAFTSGILTGDTAVLTHAGKVNWITVSDTADLTVEINDSADDSGTDRWGIKFNADDLIHIDFNPPLECHNGIWVDLSTATCRVTVGYDNM